VTSSERPLARHLVTLGIFIVATALAATAHEWNRPVTAAIVYLFGVVAVAGLAGVRGGIIAAIAASLTYNVFLSDPVYRFSLGSAEDLVPLVAFNLSAVASGLLAGRLKDRAQAAESASRRIQALFEVSKVLQAAVRLQDIPAAASGFTRGAVEIYLMDGDELRAVEGADVRPLARELLATDRASLREAEFIAFRLSASGGLLGVAVIEIPGDGDQERTADLEAFTTLLSITIERCLLLESASEAELIRRSESFKTSLLSSVSHDMRTPLSAISASASSLNRFGADLAEETKADLLNMIVEQCDRLDRYTGNLLNLTRLQSGLDGSHLVACDAVEVLGSAILRARSLKGEHVIEKSFSLSSATVRAVPVMLEQVFYNVLENAIRYSPPGSRIGIDVVALDSSVEVSVVDCGPGIPNEDLSRVFERFYRGGTAAATDGSGLGLSIAKGFTEAFGGSIVAENAEGSGAQVRIRLPLYELAAA
jgi:two-component system, OmpR family, sensor histidine kinase KdpD